MTDVNINKFRASVVRDGSKPASPGFIVSEGQDPVDPAGNGQNHLPVTIATAATGLSITDSQVLGGAGTVGQYIRGDGSLADFPQASGGGSSVSYYLNGSISQGTIGGVAYKELNKVPILGAGTDFTINADGYIASFLTDAGDPNLLEIPGGNWNFETYFSASSSGGTPTFYVELYKYDGTTFTLIASSSTSPELIAFGTNLNPYFSTLAVPTTTLALTDRLAVRYYVNHSGRTITLHTENNHLCQVVTTFTTGLTSLNGLTAQVQNLAVGTSGTDFNIASATATHTFNLPTASATNRGALSSADWTTFNNKQNALGYVPVPETRTITINGVSQDLSANRTYNVGTVTSVGLSSATSGVTIGGSPVTGVGAFTLAIATASGSQNGLLSSTDWTTFNNKQNALTNPVTGTGTTNYLPKFTGSTTIGNSQVFDNGTNVGINTNSPAQKFTIVGSNTLQSLSVGTDITHQILIGADSSYAEIQGITQGVSFNKNLILQRQGGNVGIGLNNPQTFLHLFGANTANRGQLSIQSNNVSNAARVTFYYDTFNSGEIGTTGSDLYALATNNLIFYASGDIRMQIKNSNVLIGDTTDGGQKLQVTRANDGGTILRLQSVGSNGFDFARSASTGALSIQGNQTGFNNIILAPTSGNVGIGTGSPESLSNNTTLQIDGTNHSFVRTGNSNYGGYFATIPTAEVLCIANVRNPVTGTYNNTGKAASGINLFSESSNGYITFLTTGTNNSSPNERMRITSGGNVGIGTASPDTYSYGGTRKFLTLTATATNEEPFFQLIANGSGNSLIDFGNSTIRRATIIGFDGSHLAFYTNGSNSGTSVTERMRITSSGNVLIGTTTDGSQKLRVLGTTRMYKLVTGEAGLAADNYTEFSNDDDVGYINTNRVVNNGDFHFRFNGTSRANINRTTGVYTATSDVRLKSNIENSKDAMPLINQIKIRQYQWNESSLFENFGIIAQELDQVLPNYVHKPINENDFWKISKSELVPLLVKAIQELKQEIDTLKN